ncbi:glycosyltransferase family 2 protein [Sphingomonas sp. ac-8]|uniref:glycosyltransferase family 2 protein n=1 Tax=Sphingomonas sp. ac-8 TaxID=3242977 RepID=UPI003A8116D3
MPTVSVLIPVYNRAHLVGDAIRSIVAQRFGDWELVVVDDGSSDESIAVVEAFGDPRIRVVRHARNRGIPDARNTALDAARGDLIAWLDSDDLARPERLGAQVAFLRQNPDVAMVGSCAGKIGKDGRRKRGVRVPPLGSDDIGAWLLFRSAFQQSSVMGRAELLKAYPYQRSFDVCEDLDVFVRLARRHRLANLPRVLIDRRVHPDQTVRLRQDRIRERKTQLYAGPLAELGMMFNAEDLRRHTLLGKTKLEGVALPEDFLGWADGWLRTLRMRNAESRYVAPEGMALATSWFWLLACRVAIPQVGRAAAVRAYLGSPLAKGLVGAPARHWLARSAPVVLGLRR